MGGWVGYLHKVGEVRVPTRGDKGPLQEEGREDALIDHEPPFLFLLLLLLSSISRGGGVQVPFFHLLFFLLAFSSFSSLSLPPPKEGNPFPDLVRRKDGLAREKTDGGSVWGAVQIATKHENGTYAVLFFNLLCSFIHLAKKGNDLHQANVLGFWVVEEVGVANEEKDLSTFVFETEEGDLSYCGELLLKDGCECWVACLEGLERIIFLHESLS